MNSAQQIRTINDLDRAVRSISRVFKQDAVIVVGSQAVLVGWSTPPKVMLRSEEIDLYPALENNEDGYEHSEEINALFGYESDFHQAFGFYLDGVDSSTAKLPPGWQERAVYREVEDDGKRITAIAPSLEDLIVSKLARLDDKDKTYVRACHQARSLDIRLIQERLSQVDVADEIKKRASSFLQSLPKQRPARRPRVSVEIPPFNRNTHQAFLASDGKSVIVREWDPDRQIFYKVGNNLGPAVVTEERVTYAIGGVQMDEDQWREHLDVRQAREPGNDKRQP